MELDENSNSISNSQEDFEIGLDEFPDISSGVDQISIPILSTSSSQLYSIILYIFVDLV